LPGASPKKILPEEQNSANWRFQLLESPVQFGERGLVFQTPRAMATVCRHPRVRVVSRHEDTEFVECLDCGEVFDSEEFRDMEIEATAETEPSMEDV
jgi:hypothetical protein